MCYNADRIREAQSIPKIEDDVYMQSDLHTIKRSQDVGASRQCTMRPFKGLANRIGFSG